MPETFACLTKSAAGGNTLFSFRTDSIVLIASSPIILLFGHGRETPSTDYSDKSRAPPPSCASRFLRSVKSADSYRRNAKYKWIRATENHKAWSWRILPVSRRRSALVTESPAFHPFAP